MTSGQGSVVATIARVLGALALAFLGACGQKGALVLAKPVAVVPAVGPAAAPASAASAR
jgi:predicted small lipoprotein YifL